ncbi:hypothetical protein [Rhodococcus sp. WS3]|uniref:hypothetical protein n=1 Tax=Rhodococcus sp. WS3 TaxID=2486271 RepID=UPI001650E5D1|nr:hypothetical protein [Rhodococcus sp. WS3]
MSDETNLILARHILAMNDELNNRAPSTRHYIDRLKSIRSLAVSLATRLEAQAPVASPK